MNDDTRRNDNFGDRNEIIDDDSRDDKRGLKGAPKRGMKKTFYRKKECKLCKLKEKEFDYRQIDMIRRFITEKGKIIPRRMSGNCAKCQRKIKNAINRARNAALIQFTNI